MDKSEKKPELIVIAGPNGSGKTSVTQKGSRKKYAQRYMPYTFKRKK